MIHGACLKKFQILRCIMQIYDSQFIVLSFI